MSLKVKASCANTASTISMESNISLLSHSDTSLSTVDSLGFSADNLHATSGHSKDNLKSSKESTNLSEKHSGSVFTDSSGSVGSYKKDSAFRDSLDGIGKTKKDADHLKQQIVIANNNNNKENRDSKDKGFLQPTNATRRKVPKSNTFDTSTSVFNSGGARVKFHCYDTDNQCSSSKNHVFMTSHECMVVPGCSKLPRETIASRLRFEKQHSGEKISCPAHTHAQSHSHSMCYHKNCLPEEYQTPSQRKDILLKDLKRQVREWKQMCENKDREIEMYKQHVDDETSRLVANKDAEIERLRDEVKEAKRSYEEISAFCEESVQTASVMEAKAKELKSEISDREKQQQNIYLEMYKKGRESARFEREEELERLATSGGCKVTIAELVKKLAWTELELAKWQTIRRDESYQDATRPETEADTTLRFLKDSLFHYITDEKESDHHLRAIIKIMKFTEPQMERIKESKLIQMIEKRHRKKSSKRY